MIDVTEIFLDTSIIIELLKGRISKETKQMLEENVISISIISFVETCRHVHKIGKGGQWQSLKDRLEEFKIVGIGTTVGELAAQISSRQNLSIADSIIYATALYNNMPLVTADNEFRNKKGVIIIDRRA